VKPVQIIGHAGCGKTTLIVELIKGMVKKGIKVGSLKHTAHELGKPGKDSFKHRQAGGASASMLTQMAVIYLPATDKLT